MSLLHSRLHFIDTVRGVVVILAMLAHTLVQFWPDFDVLKPLTRTATPAFVILFGIALELAYLRKVRAGDCGLAVDLRLIRRMVLCYLLFAVITLAAMSTGKLDLVAGIKSLFYLRSGRFGTILKIYAVLLLIVVLLRPWLVRHGTDLVVVAAALGWVARAAADAALSSLRVDNHFVSFVAGAGQGFGPAILPSLTFLAFGLAVGEMFTGRRGPARAGALLAAATLLVGVELASSGPGGAIDALLAARWINAPLYFAAGIVTTALYLAVAALLWGRTPVDPASRALADVGRQTLAVYAGGNVALNLLPSHAAGAAGGLALSSTFVVALLAIGLARARHPARLDRRLGGLPRLWMRVLDLVVDRCTVPIEQHLARLPGRG